MLKGAVGKKVTIAGAWGALATNGKRIALAGFDSSGKRTSELAVIDLNGRRLGAPTFAANDIRNAYRGWFTPVGLFLDTKRGLVGPAFAAARRRDTAI